VLFIINFGHTFVACIEWSLCMKLMAFSDGPDRRTFLRYYFKRGRNGSNTPEISIKVALTVGRYEPQVNRFGSVDPSNHTLDRIAHWRHLSNTTEQSVLGDDAALCQVTYSTCYYYFKLFKMCSNTLLNSRYCLIREFPVTKFTMNVLVSLIGLMIGQCYQSTTVTDCDIHSQ